MKLYKHVFIILALISIFVFGSCENNNTNDSETKTYPQNYNDENTADVNTTPQNYNEEIFIPDNFEFYLRWGCYGISSYDSVQGKLVKTTDASNPSDYITTLKLTTSELAAVYSILSELDLAAYPPIYDPHLETEGVTALSSPPMTLILKVTIDDNEFEITCENTALTYSSKVPLGDKFLKACRSVINIITDTDEWKSLPEYEFFYE